MIRKALTVAFVALVLSASGRASSYVIDQPQPDEIPPGHGLFSGEDGKFVLYGTGIN